MPIICYQLIRFKDFWSIKLEIAVLNGKTTKIEELDNSWLNYGTYFGDGVYEVIRSYNGKIFAMDDHMIRLKASLEAIEMEHVNVDAVHKQILSAFDSAGIKNAKIYMQITRGCGIRSHFLDKNMRPDVLIMVENLPDATDQKTNGIKVITYPDLRWKRCDIKSLNLLANVMATRAAQKKGGGEAILVSEQGFITEGAGSSFYTIFDNKIWTTPLNENILPSVSRKYVLKAASELGIGIVEEHVKAADASKAKEMLIGVTTRDVVGIVEFDGQQIGDGKVGKITRMLEKQFAEYTK
jgi:D-alanine transaminase